jgi:DNA processing protein
LYSALLPWSGKIDFSSLTGPASEESIRELIQKNVNRSQWKKIETSESTEHTMQIVTLSDSHYPAKLRNIPFAPPVLFYQGNLELLEESSIAIVGSRHCSKDSLSFTNRLAWAAHASHNIITGLTYGIEEAAQQALLAKQQDTPLIAVLEKGVDHVTGYRKRWMDQILAQNGLIVSAYPPSKALQKWQYKERNRLLAALSDIIVLVEASQASGSISTALTGVELGKDVYAVPHHPNRINGHGCLKLIEQGAHPLWDPTAIFGPETTEHFLLNSLDAPKSLQEISKSQAISAPEMLETLLELKRLGYIRQRGALWERI